MHTLKKVAKLAAKELSEGKIRMVASTMGNPDRIGDVIMPGAFSKKVMDGMVKDGWLDVAHNWGGEPVGMIDSVTVQGNELIIEASWHTTEDAQAQRQIVSERLSAGKKVSVSIGFRPDYENDGVKWFEKGADLLKWAEGEGYDMTLMDTAAIKKRQYCRAIKSVSELFEVSICNVGMNPRAAATESKSLEIKSKATTISAILQAKIHQSFTVAADELAVRGYMDTEERIALSSAIGDALRLFAQNINAEVGAREIDPYDVDWVASKDFDSEDDETEARAAKASSLPECLKSALAAIERAKAVSDLRAKDGRKLGAESLDVVSAINKATGELLAHVAESSQSPEAEAKADSYDPENDLLKLQLFQLTI